MPKEQQRACAAGQLNSIVLLLQAYNVKQSVVDKVHQTKEAIQGEFDKMQPRDAEDQAWTQGRIVSNTPEVEQRPAFQGSGRRILTDPVDVPESRVSVAVCTSSS